MRRQMRNQDGFTLLELLVAISIIAVGLLAAASMQGVAINSDSVANRVSVGSSLAQQVAEDLISSSSTGTVLNTNGTFNYMLDQVNHSNVLTVQSAGRFRAVYTTQTSPVISGATVTGTTQVSVTVKYIAPNAVETDVATFTTYKRL
jgi:type IV pilus assembly protein PilV